MAKPGGETVFSRGVEHTTHRSDIRPLRVVDLVVEENEHNLGDDAEDKDAPGEAIGVDL